MPANFEIRILGICLCFYKDNYWNVIFPCDDDHPAKFDYLGATQDLRTAGGVLEIVFPDVANRGEEPVPADPPVFNMSKNYAHGAVEDVVNGWKSNLELLDLTKPDPETNVLHDFVWLKIPNAVRSTATETDCRYYVQDIKSPGLPPLLLTKMAREVIFTFTAAQDFELTGKEKRSGFEKSVEKFDVSTVPNHLIEIDNDCHEHCPEENDFTHLYWIVKDVHPDLAKRKRLAAGQVRCKDDQGDVQPRMSALATDDSSGNLSATAVLAMTPYGNCDPVESIPPPGP